MCSYNNSKPACCQKCLFLNYFEFIDYNLNTSSVLDSYCWWGGSVLEHHLYFRMFWSSEACLMCLWLHFWHYTTTLFMSDWIISIDFLKNGCFSIFILCSHFVLNWYICVCSSGDYSYFFWVRKDTGSQRKPLEINLWYTVCILYVIASLLTTHLSSNCL